MGSETVAWPSQVTAWEWMLRGRRVGMERQNRMGWVGRRSRGYEGSEADHGRMTWSGTDFLRRATCCQQKHTGKFARQK